MNTLTIEYVQYVYKLTYNLFCSAWSKYLLDMDIVNYFEFLRSDLNFAKPLGVKNSTTSVSFNLKLTFKESTSLNYDSSTRSDLFKIAGIKANSDCNKIPYIQEV